MTNFRTKLRNFFFPPRGVPRYMLILPIAIYVILGLALLVGGAYAWDYTNSSVFCGTSCHTMPPEYAAYEISPHARIACVECHIGREFIGNQFFRKAGDVRHIVAMTFETYEYPITTKHMRPAPEICEKCHSPEKFSDDSLRVITRYDEEQTPYNIYLVLKTGGGSEREGLGRGIHWHIENPVFYYSEDERSQSIPYVKVVQNNAFDGSTVEYIDVETDFDISTIDESELKQMDCITCHNRITHRIYTPEESMDHALTLGKISTNLTDIRVKGIEVLRGNYSTQEEGLAAIADLDTYYKNTYPEFYASNAAQVAQAIEVIQGIYTDSVFIEQKVDWDSHPNNLGHIDAPGCFRCHDGKHLNADDEAIRLECNLCHSIPVVAGTEDFVANVEINRGIEPSTHLNPNWISLHNKSFDATCENCHTIKDAGGTSNVSFCSNSACHGSVYSFAGFDAPKLREILAEQLHIPEPEAAADLVTGEPTFDANVGALFADKCSVCHGESGSAGLNVTSYAALMKGSDNGPVIAVGDSGSSKLVEVQSDSHFANFDEEQLQFIINWIDAGAPEK